MEFFDKHPQEKITRSCCLYTADLPVLTGLSTLLDPLAKATEHFSASRVPLVSDVILCFDNLNIVYEALEEMTSPVLRNSVQRMLVVLKKYYELTDSSKMYRLAVREYSNFYTLTHRLNISVLHPSLKLQYLKKAQWEEKWISTSEEILQSTFQKYYQVKPAPEVSADKRDEPRYKHPSSVSFSVIFIIINLIIYRAFLMT